MQHFLHFYHSLHTLVGNYKTNFQPLSCHISRLSLLSQRRTHPFLLCHSASGGTKQTSIMAQTWYCCHSWSAINAPCMQKIALLYSTTPSTSFIPHKPTAFSPVPSVQNLYLTTYVHRLVFAGVWAKGGDLLSMCNNVKLLDITLDVTQLASGVNPNRSLWNLDAEEICQGLKPLPNLLPTSFCRKRTMVDLTLPKQKYVLAGIAKAMHN